MSEHFNIIGWGGKSFDSRHKSSLVQFAFREFGHVFGRPSEMMVMDVHHQVARHEVWDPNSDLFSRSIGAGKLLFIYGEFEGRHSGSRASVGIEEASSGSSLAFSVPKDDVERNPLFVESACRALCLEMLRQSLQPVIVAGWEFELPGLKTNQREFLREAATHTPQIEWLALPSDKVSEVPGFATIEDNSGVVLLRRKRSAGLH